MILKLPRVIRLDQSDTIVFEHPAEPGDWAVTGSFLFWDEDIPNLAGKRRAAFRSGFLGVPSFGFSTLVEVGEASEQERDELVEALAGRIYKGSGAPDISAAHRAASAEVAFAASLCQFDVETIIAMHRTLQAGEIKEQFRTLRRSAERAPGTDRLHAHARAFTIVETDEPEETIDLSQLMGGAS
jgi:hypothetical protein